MRPGRLLPATGLGDVPPLEKPLLRLSRTRLAPFLAAALFVWLGYLVLSPLTYNQLHVFEATLRQQALFVIAGIAYLAHLAYHRRLPGPTRLDLPLVLVLGAYALAIAFSIYPRFSLEASFLVGMAVLTFYIFSDIDELTPPLLVRGLAAIGVVGALFALYEVAADCLSWSTFAGAVEGKTGVAGLLPPTVPRVSGVGDHVNMIALAFNLTLPFALSLALDGQRVSRWIAAAGCVLIVVALFFTVSRGAWVSAAVALPVFALLYARRDTGLPRLSAVRIRRPVLAATIAVIAVIGLVGAGAAASRWESRPEWLFRSSLSPRYDAFDVALRIFRDEPWLGAGPNTFSLLYNVYSGDYPIEDFHPHNGYLAVLVDSGLVGAVAVAALALTLIAVLVNAYRAGTPQRRVWAAACIAALTALAVHSLMDMPNQSKTVLLLIAVIAALALKVGPRPVAPSRPLSLPNLPRYLVLAFVPLFLSGWLWTDLGHRAYDQSLDALLQGDFDASVKKALDASGREPDFGAYHLHAGTMQAVDYLVRKDGGETMPGLLDGAIVSLDRAVELDPRSGIAYANLALALRLKGDAAGAIDAARSAIARSPGDGTVAAIAGVVLEYGEQWDEAVSAYSKAVTHDPTLIESSFWASTPFRRDVRAEVFGNTFLTACQKARVVALYSRYAEDDLMGLDQACRRQVEGSPSDARARSDLAIALYRTGATEEAEAQARRAVGQAPDNAYARTALGFVLLDRDTLADARHELMLGAQLGDPDALVLLAMSYQLSLGGAREIPGEVLDRMEAALPTAAPFAFDNGIQHYLLGILYYRPRYFRESPATIIIPSELTARAGEYPLLASPRVDAIERALREAGRR